ncbi:MAG: helix-turn-helix transcriptional regulator [Polyangiales bacterium]
MPRVSARPYAPGAKGPTPRGGVAEGARPGARFARFGERLRALRTAASLTQAELAERADLDVSYVSQLERGLRDPSLSSIEAVAGALGLSVAQFFDDAAAAAGAARDAQARAIAQELSSLDEESRRDFVEILRRFRAALERAASRRS